MEVLAENIATRLLADPRIIWLRIRLEKPEAIAEAAGVGVEIERLSRRIPVISQAKPPKLLNSWIFLLGAEFFTCHCTKMTFL